MSENIKIRGGHCRECKYYRPTGKRDALWTDGICVHPTRNGKNRKTPYKVSGGCIHCFDAEDPDDYEQEEMKWDE